MHIQVPALASWPRSSSGATRTFRGTPQSPLRTGASISARNVRVICTADPVKSSPDCQDPPRRTAHEEEDVRTAGRNAPG